jgi:hypothetical protein
MDAAVLRLLQAIPSLPAPTSSGSGSTSSSSAAAANNAAAAKDANLTQPTGVPASTRVRVPTSEERYMDQEVVPLALLINQPRVGRRLLFNSDIPSGSFLYQSPTGYCTFPLTGRRQTQQQAWRNCRTCGLVDNTVCSI